MYMQAYQSYVFNRLCTARLRLGRTPMVGDLVLVGRHQVRDLILYVREEIPYSKRTHF